ncbi:MULTISPECIES: DUF3221 domain-containing protein [unclassified Clostridium]|uniref:DUF3221 domain-containing protein n=2 Tax=Clostridiaceae TaxID=31979 RepID=UPI001C8CBBED|nr:MULTISPECIES: DUF3221 domain-containing protein [unclassified Clostridium]MBX9136876.1 DUF3221 domain-containing protein [Clostridium sp. K12(2020)]MBX9143686.1 DUF3221 domain-containing protein [Clostridium sp. K13]MDU2291445.1 DUF3221 domain-containing protein [Clostridium celatum]MDU4326289.1 DUF3221 domain-containing protein [Clostridium celatum]
MRRILKLGIILIFSIFILIGCSSTNKMELEGRYLRCGKANVIIDENGQPIVMNNISGNDELFDNLKNGDKIKIKCSEILESYPAQTQVDKFIFIEDGDISDIPESTIKSLKELGWEID